MNDASTKTCSAIQGLTTSALSPVLQLSLHFPALIVPISSTLSTFAAGRWTITGDVPTGSYSVDADWNADGKDHHASSEISVVAEQPHVVRLAEFFGELRGTVRVTDRSIEQAPPSNVQLICGPEGYQQRMTAKVALGGSYSFSDIRYANCSLHFASEEALNVNALALNGEDLGGEVSSFHLQAEGNTLDVGATHDAGIIAAWFPAEADSWRNGIVAQNARSGDISVFTRTGPGQYQSPLLVPGDYWVCAWDDIPDVPYRTSWMMRRCSQEGDDVEVKVATKQEVHTRLLRLDAH